MQGSDYIFLLQDKEHRFYKFTPTGVVLSADPYVIDFSPQGWQDIDVDNVRNKTYWGIDRTVSAPLQFVNDGAAIIKYIIYSKGPETEVYLTIGLQKLDFNPGVDFGFWYKELVSLQLDLSSAVHTGPRVSVATLEDGLSKYLKSNENTRQEYPLSDPERILVKMDGINLHEKLNYANIDAFDISAGLDNGKMLPCVFSGHDGDSTGVVYQSEDYKSISLASNPANEGQSNFMAKNVSQVSLMITVSGLVQLICTQRTASVAGSNIRLITQKNGAQVTNNQIAPIFDQVPGVLRSFPFSFTVPLNPGESVFMFDNFNIIGTSCTYQFTKESVFNISFLTRHPDTYIPAFRGQYLWNKLIADVTENNLTAELSAYLLANKNIVFTSGNGLRLLDGASVKIQFSEFFQFYNCYDAVGIIEKDGKVDIARKEDLVDAANSIHVEAAVNSIKISFAKEYFFNELEIGYPDLDNDIGVLNGNAETNTGMLFSTGTSISPARLDKVSKAVKTSPYEIEKIRITTFSKDTTDFKDDNSLYAIAISPDRVFAYGDIPEHYILDRSPNPGTQGLIEPDTIFNIPLSPKRNLLRQGSYLRSCGYLWDYKTLAFKSADRNDKMISNGIVENADVNIGSLAPAFFVPVRLTGDFAMPDDLLELLDENPLRVFDFDIDGNNYKGFLETVGLNPSDRKLQPCTFLSLASNDISKLKNYYG